jgi:ASC-1-like (ASCH) protein
MIYQMKLHAEPFNDVLSGRKIIESRLYDEKRQKLQIGDQIEFVNSSDSAKAVMTTIQALHRADSFEKLFSNIPIEDFGGKSKEQLLEQIGKFYSVEDQQRFGVVGIQVKVIKSPLQDS